MQYLEPRSAHIGLDDIVIHGIISGSSDSVKFESKDDSFLNLFPTGQVDSLSLDENNCTQSQQDFVTLAQEMVRQYLNH